MHTMRLSAQAVAGEVEAPMKKKDSCQANHGGLTQGASGCLVQFLPRPLYCARGGEEDGVMAQA